MEPTQEFEFMSEEDAIYGQIDQSNLVTEDQYKELALQLHKDIEKANRFVRNCILRNSFVLMEEHLEEIEIAKDFLWSLSTGDVIHVIREIDEEYLDNAGIDKETVLYDFDQRKLAYLKNNLTK